MYRTTAAVFCAGRAPSTASGHQSDDAGGGRAPDEQSLSPVIGG